MIDFGYKTGPVDLYDWDVSIARGFGAQEDAQKNEWFLPLEGIYVPVEGRKEPITRALVVYKRPEPTSIKMLLPEIAIIRDAITPADNRLLSPVTSWWLPSEGAQQVSAGGQLGWTSYNTRDMERPYDLFYTIECWSRYRVVAQMLLQMMMARYPIRGSVTLIDGIGNERTYATFQQTTADLTQVASVVDRVCGFSISIRFEAELTNERQPFDLSAFTGTRSKAPLPGGSTQLVPGPGGYGLVPADSNGIPLNNGGNADPDPGPGGLYGTGLPIIRQSIAEDK